MFHSISFAVVLYCVTTVSAYSDCGSKVGSVVSVTVNNCDEDSRCVLKRGTNASIAISFTTNVDATEITAIVHGVVLGVPIPFSLPNPDGCKDSGVTCPIAPGKTYEYHTDLPVKTDYLRVTVDVKWELKTKDGQDLICILIPSKIQ